MDQTSDPFTARRRAPRVGFELMVRCKHGLSRSTVMLKDMTNFGARIEGLDSPVEGEAISLMLPGEAPRLAFVIWSTGAAAGLEFADPLSAEVFEAMKRDHALGSQPLPALEPPLRQVRAAA